MNPPPVRLCTAVSFLTTLNVRRIFTGSRSVAPATFEWPLKGVHTIPQSESLIVVLKE